MAAATIRSKSTKEVAILTGYQFRYFIKNHMHIAAKVMIGVPIIALVITHIFYLKFYYLDHVLLLVVSWIEPLRLKIKSMETFYGCCKECAAR
ncbi:uncharacterized protein LOC141606565 isoform X3 [Silene latifolia]|uniref:uncharacterized protein LOC141606565 isoform X3 n=1 Tax=Silene latifolia TaxID=37657 RepID=UPI003D76F087